MIARIFPRRTAATPDDAFAFTGEPGLFVPDGLTAVHVSVAFTYDLPRAEYLARSWARTGLPTEIGGPATGTRGEEFVPGRYLRDGYTITSRGCDNRCWFCSVWRREGGLRELPIHDGCNVLDDNLLACSEAHVRAVFAMLARVKRERHQPIEFTGGLEAARLQPWHVDLLADLRPKQMFFAYDEPADYEPLVAAGRMLREVFTDTSRSLRAYVLCGHPRDTPDAAEARFVQTLEAGFWPAPMVYRNERGERRPEFIPLARTWFRPASAAARFREIGGPR